MIFINLRFEELKKLNEKGILVLHFRNKINIIAPKLKV
jgi:hypothetical protein